jgi:hypothetical protein
VNTMLNQDTLREATRLTQAGQLTEATALLQRMLRGERPLAEAAAAKGLISLPGRTPPTIDLKANGVGNADRAAPAETPAATARRHRPLFGRAKDGTWLGLRDAKRAPASMTDIVPEGAKFIDGNYGNKAGSRTYKLFIPSSYHQGQPLPLVVMLHGCTKVLGNGVCAPVMRAVVGSLIGGSGNDILEEDLRSRISKKLFRAAAARNRCGTDRGAKARRSASSKDGQPVPPKTPRKRSRTSKFSVVPE